MIYVLTESERRFIMEVLGECGEYSDDLESGCEEAISILAALEKQPIETADE